MLKEREQSVSIALATYRGERFLEQQLESLLLQTMLPDEIIVCDDSPNSKTQSVVRALQAEAPCEIRYFQNTERLHITKNFENAISRCSGDIVFLCDQDDIWHADKVSTMTRYLIDHPKTGAVFCNARVVDRDLNPLGYGLWEMLWFSSTEQAKVKAGRAVEVFLKHVVASGNTLAFRACYRDLVLPFPNLGSCHDAWTALLIGVVSEVTMIDRMLVDYRMHGDNSIGIGKPNLWNQIRMAKKQLDDDAFGYAIELCKAAQIRLSDRSVNREGISESVDVLMKGKIEHCTIRSQMAKGFLARLSTVLREVCRGNYRKYSYGYKSILQDLFLR